MNDNTTTDLPPAEPLAWLPGWRHIHVKSVGSTNAELMHAARRGETGRLWLTAGRQTKGRGRRGRDWVSPAGNLYASVLLTDDVAGAPLDQLPLVISIAAHIAVAAAMPDKMRPAVAIKWPNDILIDGAKCCGILMESGKTPAGTDLAVIGCGINVASVPPGLPYSATSLAGDGATANAQAVFRGLADALAQTLETWNRGRNFGAVRQLWLQHAQGIGSPVTVRLARATLEGVMDGIDPQGRLLLRMAGGQTKTISAGDVFLR